MLFPCPLDKSLCIFTMWSRYAIIEKKIRRLSAEYCAYTKSPIGVPERINSDWCSEVRGIHRIVLENKGVIEIDMEENYFSVIGTKIAEIVIIQLVFTEIDNQIGLFTWRYLSHMLIMRHNSHLKHISRTKFMTENMPRHCIADIVENTLNFFCTAAIFRRNTRFDILEMRAIKKTKKSPGRVTRGVELRGNEKLPGHKSEQVHH